MFSCCFALGTLLTHLLAEQSHHLICWPKSMTCQKNIRPMLKSTSTNLVSCCLCVYWFYGLINIHKLRSIRSTFLGSCLYVFFLFVLYMLLLCCACFFFLLFGGGSCLYIWGLLPRKQDPDRVKPENTRDLSPRRGDWAGILIPTPLPPNFLQFHTPDCQTKILSKRILHVEGGFS